MYVGEISYRDTLFQFLDRCVIILEWVNISESTYLAKLKASLISPARFAAEKTCIEENKKDG